MESVVGSAHAGRFFYTRFSIFLLNFGEDQPMNETSGCYAEHHRSRKAVPSYRAWRPGQRVALFSWRPSGTPNAENG
jgi:hypothetical protein